MNRFFVASITGAAGVRHLVWQGFLLLRVTSVHRGIACQDTIPVPVSRIYPKGYITISTGFSTMRSRGSCVENLRNVVKRQVLS